ncbi:MAG: cysteine desulfurase [Candidatus Eremiobacteraeota bacterium]|nr:cysteine desulfurase [Candidatus Eremiobacteraeota bacterium]
MNQNPERIYLDYAATTPLRSEVRDAIERAFDAAAFNPSSLHAEGRRARALIDEARERVASLLGAMHGEIVFTSGGTEADNLAIVGAARASRDGERRHLVTSAIEHHAVLHTFEALREEGFEVTVVGVDESGTVNPEAFAAAVRDDTLLASVMYANNEIGSVQPIADLARIAHAHGAIFHTDAVQAPLWLPLNVGGLGVDSLSLSAHKFQGPQGVGALYVRKGIPFRPLLHGGGQERGRRAGTENSLGIVGLARALELAIRERDETSRRVSELRNRLEVGVQAAIGGVRINAERAVRLPNVAHLSFQGLESDALLLGFDLSGLAVSAGSACTSGVLEPSHVLAALGVEPRWQRGAVRFSLGPPTTKAEIERVLGIVPNAIAALRVESPA